MKGVHQLTRKFGRQTQSVLFQLGVSVNSDIG